MAIKSSAGVVPEFCHPACNEDYPCKGKVCPYKETSESKSHGSHRKESGSRKFNPTSSSRKNGVNATVSKPYHLLEEKGNTGNYDGGTEKADGLLIDKRFLWGVGSGIGLIFSFEAMILGVFYAARNILE